MKSFPGGQYASAKGEKPCQDPKLLEVIPIVVQKSARQTMPAGHPEAESKNLPRKQHFHGLSREKGGTTIGPAPIKGQVAWCRGRGKSKNRKRTAPGRRKSGKKRVGHQASSALWSVRDLVEKKAPQNDDDMNQETTLPRPHFPNGAGTAAARGNLCPNSLIYRGKKPGGGQKLYLWKRKKIYKK